MSTSDKNFKVLADVIISDSGDIGITNMNPINYTPHPIKFTIENERRKSNPIIKLLIGEYKLFIPNCYINSQNTVILFINSKWMLYFYYENKFFYFNYERKDTTYMDINDILELFNTDYLICMDKGVKSTKAIIDGYKTTIGDSFKRMKISS